MARKLQAMPADMRTVYDWDLWLDGSVWALEPEVDFPNTNLASFRSLLSKRAAKLGIKVVTRLNGDELVIQAVRSEGVSR